MLKLSAFWRLMRFDKPMGIALLWAPTAWALWLSNRGRPDLKLIWLFLLGTIVMRAAGCVINDIADRKFDGYVKRTQMRPLASFELGATEAVCIFIFLLFLALWVVLQLPINCLYQSFLALFITLIYPFMKRFFVAPQLFLGLAFSMGIPIAYSAALQKLNLDALLLFIINFIWIISYDTIYAMADKKYDLLIGVRSTAILFGKYDKLIVLILQAVVQFLWLLLAYKSNFNWIFYLFWMLGNYVCYKQQKLIYLHTEKAYFRGFLLNGWYGLIIWFGIMLSL